LNINRSSKEKSFEEILKNHPYLVDESLIGGKVKEQYHIVLKNGFNRYIDLIYFKEDDITIIELKRDIIRKKDISQLSEYVNHVKLLFPEKQIKGILVGQEIDKEILKIMDLRGFIYKQLFTDIPIHIKICLDCRKANNTMRSKCKWCGSEKFLSS